MAVQQVRAKVHGTWHTLTYNGTSGKYEKQITAPTITSFNEAGGYYPVEIEATDDHGNVASDTTTGRLTVKETTKPVINITSPASGSYLSSNTPPIVFTLRDETNGSGIKLTTLAMKIDSTTYTSASAGMICTPVTGGYNCTYTPQSALSDGSHTITVNVADNDGNTGTQKTASFTVDTVAPTLNLTAPVNNLKTNIALCNVIGATNDDTSSSVAVTVKLNGIDQGAVTVSGGNFTKAITLGQGSNTIVVRSTDLAGKFTEVTRTVSLNTMAPTISNVAITPNPADTGASIVVSCTVTDS